LQHGISVVKDLFSVLGLGFVSHKK